MARLLLRGHPQGRVILSSNLPIDGQDARILDGSELTFRENAELSHYCTLLVGCSSGLSWVCTSEAARRLPTVQILSRDAFNCNALSVDHAVWGLPTDHLLEMYDAPSGRTIRCVDAVLADGFAAARARFHERPPRRFYTYQGLWRTAFYRREYRTTARLMWRNKAAVLYPAMWGWYLGVIGKWLLQGCPRPSQDASPDPAARQRL